MTASPPGDAVIAAPALVHSIRIGELPASGQPVRQAPPILYQDGQPR